MRSPATGRELNCGNCEHAQERHTSAAAAEAAARAGHPVPPLHCCWDPQTVAKRPADWCGRHSALVLLRMEQLADLIALAVARRPQPQDAAPQDAGGTPAVRGHS